MRIQFSLTCQKGVVIPINYQAEISNWVLDVLASGGDDLQNWAQQRGYDLRGHTFKMFSFSPLAIFPYEMNQTTQEFRLLGNQVKISVSLYIDPGFEQSIISLFRQKPLRLGIFEGQPSFFEVKHWQVLPRPHFREVMQFKAMSPISITEIEDEKLPNPFLLPDSETYDICFFTHAIRRFKASNQYKSLNNMKLLDASFPMQFRHLAGQAKSRLIHLKPNVERLNQLRGFTYEFEVTMPIPLMEFCYYAGFGEYPQLGFGFVEIK
jgi:CRISPR-associated endoribonuclease Cas6